MNRTVGGSSSDDDEQSLSSIPAGYCGPGDARGEVLVVEKLVDVKTLKYGGRAFLVKWMGFPDFKNTWEPEEGLPEPLARQFDEEVELDEDYDNSKGNFNDSDIGSSEDGTASLIGSRPNSIMKQPSNKFGEAKFKSDTFFPKGWIAEEIQGLQTDKGMTKMVVKFKGKDKVLPVSLSYCKRKIPQLVIQFFQKHLSR